MVEKHTIHAHAKCHGVNCEVKRELVLKDIGQFDGPLDVRYLQRKLSAAGYMRKAARDLLDVMEGSAGNEPERERLRVTLDNFLNCDPSPATPQREGE